MQHFYYLYLYGGFLQQKVHPLFKRNSLFGFLYMFIFILLLAVRNLHVLILKWVFYLSVSDLSL